MPNAARLADPIGHSPAMSGLLTGLLIGAGIALAAIAIVGTGGLAAVAIVGGLAAAGAGVGEVVSSMSFVPKDICGAINPPCASNVFINGKPAARAHVDFALCGKHGPSPQVIASGSGNVYINGQPAARINDKTSCSAVITEGSKDVFIGGGTQQTDAILPENLVPGWVHAALFVVGAASAIVLAGPIVAALGLAGGLLGGEAGNWIGGRIFGEGSDGQKWCMLGGSFLGGIAGAKGGSVLAGKLIPTPTSELGAFTKGGLPELGEFQAQVTNGAINVADAPVSLTDILNSKWGKANVDRALAAKRASLELDSLLTDDEYLAIRGYTSPLYSEINPALRSGDPGDWQVLADNASSGMKKLAENGYGFDGEVVRNAKFTDRQVADLFPAGGTYTEGAFLSTTSDLGGVFPGNVQFHINSRSGVLVQDLSEYPNESEVLFKPQTTFSVLDKTYDTASNTWHIFMSELK